ncbi:hypothetical protein BY996DRAFT_6415624 [Phakopsora pachyrhizi]|nr:hypothetical protein BY996DRAFT_6415624 [Phakopsora pachyrhizi]
MTPLENSTHLSSAPFPHPTDDNSNDNNEHNEDEDEYEEEDKEEEEEEDEDEEKDNDANEFFTTNFSILLHLVSVNQQLATPNLKNYQGTLTKSETNPIDISMEASSQVAIFDGEIEVITKEAFLKNITVANRHLCLVIDNPSLPSYIQGKVKEATDLLRADEETAPETSSGLENNIITVNKPGIANSTQTVLYDQQANIAESQANSIHNSDSEEPQSMTGAQIPSQVETSNFLTCSNISHQPTNSNASGDPNNIPSTLTVGPPNSNCTPFNSDLAINTAVTNSANTLIPKIPLPDPVSCPSQFFLQHEDILSATLGNIYHLKTSSGNITLETVG